MKSWTKKLWQRKWWLAILILLLLVFGPYLFSRAMSGMRDVRVFENASGAEGDFKNSQLKIVAYNIAHGRGATDSNMEEPAADKRKRISHIASWLKQQDADIVVLNEVDFSATWSDHQNQGAAIAKEAGYQYWVEQRNMDFRLLYGSWKFGNVILSKFPIDDAHLVEFPEPNRWERWACGIKQGVVCTIRLSESKKIRVFGVHTDFRNEAIRVKSVKAMLDEIKTSDIPLIAAGDFNSTPTRLPCSNRAPDESNAMETLEAADYFAALPIDTEQPKLTFSSQRPHTTIDWILIPKAYRYKFYDVPASDLSDHLPVVAIVEIR